MDFTINKIELLGFGDFGHNPLYSFLYANFEKPTVQKRKGTLSH